MIQKFLTANIEYLLANTEAFKEKLAKGDIQSIKLLFDYYYKLNYADKQRSAKYTRKINGDNYEKVFEQFKDNIIEG
jgi:hypothetical protein